VEGIAGTVTLLLHQWRSGDPTALEKLTPLVYAELRKLAARHLRGERSDHQFRPTDLVSEAYLRLIGDQVPEWTDRVHFFAFASRIMRRVLVDHARQRDAGKRGGGARPITLDEALVAVDGPEKLLAHDNPLEEISPVDNPKPRPDELHYFGGLTQREIADVLDVHVNSVANDLRFAEAWLNRNLRGEA
jgi:RNA polymerase sigma factor (TIGR02999 family)